MSCVLALTPRPFLGFPTTRLGLFPPRRREPISRRGQGDVCVREGPRVPVDETEGASYH